MPSLSNLNAVTREQLEASRSALAIVDGTSVSTAGQSTNDAYFRQVLGTPATIELGPAPTSFIPTTNTARPARSVNSGGVITSTRGGAGSGMVRNIAADIAAANTAWRVNQNSDGGIEATYDPTRVPSDPVPTPEPERANFNRATVIYAIAAKLTDDDFINDTVTLYNDVHAVRAALSTKLTRVSNRDIMMLQDASRIAEAANAASVKALAASLAMSDGVGVSEVAASQDFYMAEAKGILAKFKSALREIGVVSVMFELESI